MIGVYIVQSVSIISVGFFLYLINFQKYFSYDEVFMLLELNNDNLKFNKFFFQNLIYQLFTSFEYDYLTYSFFIFGFSCFLLSTLLSLLSLSFLGLYGVFIVNLITIIIMWLSLIVTFIDIFEYNAFYYIDIGNWMFSRYLWP